MSVLINVAAVVVVALALHLADWTDPVRVRVELDPGIELPDGRGLGAEAAIRWQANLAGLRVADARNGRSRLAGLGID
jgi:sensor c-di-GMP phosphodiesterase-like protein